MTYYHSHKKPLALFFISQKRHSLSGLIHEVTNPEPKMVLSVSAYVLHLAKMAALLNICLRLLQ